MISKLCTILVLGACAGMVQAAPGDLIRVIRSPNPETGGMFGMGPITVGGHIVVGHYYADLATLGGPIMTNVGAVRVYSGISGHLQRTVWSPEPTAGDTCANTPIRHGGNVLMQCIGDDYGAPDAGSVYLISPLSGQVLLTLRNPEPAKGDWFGLKMASVRGNIVVAAPYADRDGVTDVGRVYVFDGVTGELRFAIPNPEPGHYDYFGHALAEHNGNILVGAYFDDTGGHVDAGTVYLFDGGNGALLLTIRKPGGPVAGDQFGYTAVSVAGRIVVGAPGDDLGAANAGAVYVFDGLTGAHLLTIPNPQPAAEAAGDNFGHLVARHRKSYIVISAPWDDPGAVNNAGTVYLFHVTGGAPLLTIPNPEPGVNDIFGRVPAVGEVEDHWGQILIGCHFDDVPGPDGVPLTNVGSLYIFEGLPE